MGVERDKMWFFEGWGKGDGNCPSSSNNKSTAYGAFLFIECVVCRTAIWRCNSPAHLPSTLPKTSTPWGFQWPELSSHSHLWVFLYMSITYHQLNIPKPNPSLLPYDQYISSNVIAVLLVIQPIILRPIFDSSPLLQLHFQLLLCLMISFSHLRFLPSALAGIYLMLDYLLYELLQ